jgi:hypothetical protein
MLVPRKIIVDDKEYIWSCPDELVPSQEELAKMYKRSKQEIK